jgi:hypothetical protein
MDTSTHIIDLTVERRKRKQLKLVQTVTPRGLPTNEELAMDRIRQDVDLLVSIGGIEATEKFLFIVVANLGAPFKP